jgi:hypothetical protein
MTWSSTLPNAPPQLWFDYFPYTAITCSAAAVPVNQPPWAVE